MRIQPLSSECRVDPSEYHRQTAALLPRPQRDGYPVRLCVDALEHAAREGNDTARVALGELVRSARNGELLAGCRICGLERAVGRAILAPGAG